MAISKNHYIDLVDGKFHGTSADELEELFKVAEASEQRDHLVVHFHGGLVPRKSAEGIAEKLLPDYIAGGAYPVFFFWNSGALKVLATNLDEVAKEPAFQRLVRRLAQLLAGKLAESIGARGLTIQTESLKDVPEEPVDLLAWTQQHEPIAGATFYELTKLQRDQIERELKQDAVLIEESRAIAEGLREPEEIEQDLMSRARGAPSVRASRKTLMSPHILKRIAEEAPERDTRSIATIVAIAKYGVEIAAAVIGRYLKGRDHGLHTTIVEEVARTLYVDSIGSTVWALMKNDTKDAFGDNSQVHGGTAFIDHLVKWWKPGRRVTLVGHSTGAIYLGYLIEHANSKLPPEAKFEVVFLAPACTFDFVDKLLPVFSSRVSGFRMFALLDDLERGYWEVPLLYPASLLYMVSGLFEDPVVDMPIVGMQRYFDLSGPYNQPEILSVKNWIADRCVWSVSVGAPGLQTETKKHGEFDEDEKTRLSLKYLLANGF